MDDNFVNSYGRLQDGLQKTHHVTLIMPF